MERARIPAVVTRAPLLVAFLVPLVGCGSGGFATAPGASVLAPTVTSVTLASLGGGYGPELPAGAPCDAGVFSYTIGFDTGHLTATLCRLRGPFDQPASYMPLNDDLMLSQPQIATLRGAVRGIVVSDRTTCGADAATRELRVEASGADLTYGDDFYACLKMYQHYVKFEGLDNLGAVLQTIDPL